MTAILLEQLRGYRLTTAEIVYRMPDHRHMLQSFIWQHLDQAPRFPRLTHFLNFWQENLEGPIHSVRVAQKGIISDAELRFVGERWELH